MRHRLYLKFLSLIAVKGLVIGHAQWTGALTIPSHSPAPLRPSGLAPELIETTAPSIPSQQNIHQF
jgi:hypothetical protein